MNLLSYVLRRLVFGTFVLLAVITITFIISHFMGGNVIQAWLGRAAGLHPQLTQLYVQKYHLNSSIWVQYYYYLVGLMQGNLGYSPSRSFVPVTAVIKQTLPLSLQLMFLAYVISFALGILFGIVSAKHSHTAVDGGIRGFYLAGFASPAFFVALVLLMVFPYTFGLLPSGGAVDPGLQAPHWITGFPLIDSLLEGDWAFFVSMLEHAILPALTLALVSFGMITRLLRNSLLEVMHANYIRTARAKGLGESAVFYKHALRNALMPVVSLSTVIVTWLITDIIFVENVFAYPGIGQYVVGAISGQDYPGILGTTIVFAVIIVLVNLGADLLYAVVDPQVRLG